MAARAKNAGPRIGFGGNWCRWSFLISLLVAASVAGSDFPAALPGETSIGEPAFTAREGSFTLPSDLEGNREVKVVYHVPEDAEGNLVDSASDVVFYAPYIGQKDPLREDYIRKLTMVHGMTVFSLEIGSDHRNVNDREKMYYYAESGSFDLMKRAWAKVRSLESLDQRKLLVTGNSGGSTMAHGLAVAMPKALEGVALVGGSRYVEGDFSKVPLCVVTKRGDLRLPENLRLLARAEETQAPFLLAVTPACANEVGDFSEQRTNNFHHSAQDAGLDIAVAYLCDLRDRRRSRLTGGDEDLRVPLRFGEVPAGTLDDEEGAEAKEARLAGFAGQMLPAPGPVTLAAWERNPNRFAQISVGEESLPVLARYPSDPETRGVVIYGGRVSGSAAETGDGLDFIGLHGWIGVGIPAEFGQALEIEEWKALVDWVLAREEWQDYSVHLVGWDDAARDFLVLAAKENWKRVRSVTALEGLLTYPEVGRSPIKSVAGLRVPVVIGGTRVDYSSNKPATSYAAAAREGGIDLSVIQPARDVEGLEESWDLLRGALVNLGGGGP